MCVYKYHAGGRNIKRFQPSGPPTTKRTYIH